MKKLVAFILSVLLVIGGCVLVFVYGCEDQPVSEAPAPPRPRATAPSTWGSSATPAIPATPAEPALPDAPAGSSSVSFNQAFRPGFRYHQTMTMSQQMEIDTGSGKLTQETSTTTGMLATVAALDDGRHKRVTVKYDAVSATKNENGVKYSYDSKSPNAAATEPLPKPSGAPPANPLAAYSKVVGQEFKVIFDDSENVTDVENLTAAMQSLSGDPNEANVYQQVFNPDAIKHMMQQSVLRSPSGKPINIGGLWPFSQEFVMAGIGKLQIHGFYTFNKMVKRDGIDCAEVSAAAEIKLEVATATADDPQPMAQTMKLQLETGSLAGTLYYDPAIRYTRELAITHNLTLTGRLTDGSGKPFRLPMKQEIGMKLDSIGPMK